MKLIFNNAFYFIQYIQNSIISTSQYLKMGIFTFFFSHLVFEIWYVY